jgi:hypothetical protein
MTCQPRRYGIRVSRAIPCNFFHLGASKQQWIQSQITGDITIVDTSIVIHCACPYTLLSSCFFSLDIEVEESDKDLAVS